MIFGIPETRVYCTFGPRVEKYIVIPTCHVLSLFSVQNLFGKLLGFELTSRKEKGYNASEKKLKVDSG